MVKKIGLAVIGCGRIGQVHARNLASLPGLQLTFVYDPVTAVAKKLATALNVPVAQTAAEIFNDKDTAGLIICSPTPMHTQQIKQAVRAGKAVLCEKPLAGSYKESIACMRFVKQHKGLLLVGFNRPYDNGFYALRQRVARAEIGQVEHVRITSRDPAAPPIAYIKASGGIFLDMMIHDFEMALRLLPDPPVRISVMAAALTDKAIGKAGDHDSALVALQTASGVTCSIHNSRRAAYGYDQRLEVFGSKGMLQAQNLHEDNLLVATKQGFSQAPLQNFFLERYNQSYKNIVATFVAAMRGDKLAQQEVKLTNGLNAIYLAERAALALKSRKLERLKLPYSP